ncbi:hypothetical protein DRQ12_06530 [candidate division KSB1 bacterium]|nr:MAG: hypothetical protein DRQ12_06530 [candidate division KSB1 bacterium]
MALTSFRFCRKLKWDLNFYIKVRAFCFIFNILFEKVQKYSFLYLLLELMPVLFLPNHVHYEKSLQHSTYNWDDPLILEPLSLHIQ